MVDQRDHRDRSRVDCGHSAMGQPCPGGTLRHLQVPRGRLLPRLSLTSTPGSGQECLWVQVLYRHTDEAYAPFHYGPSTCTWSASSSASPIAGEASAGWGRCQFCQRSWLHWWNCITDPWHLRWLRCQRTTALSVGTTGPHGEARRARSLTGVGRVGSTAIWGGRATEFHTDLQGDWGSAMPTASSFASSSSSPRIQGIDFHGSLEFGSADPVLPSRV